jgi:hypothetical protein
MRASLLFVVPIALSREEIFAAGAAPPRRSAKVAWLPSPSSVEGLSRLRGVRLVALARKQTRKARILAPLPPGHKAKIQVGLAQSRPSSSDPTHSWASAVGVWLLLSVSIYSFSSSVARSACASSVGMLRHPNANTNTKHGCGSPSVA